MDANSIAQEVANHLRGRDDIATADVGSEDPAMPEPLLNDQTRIDVRTQGGALYTVYVNGHTAAEGSTTQ